MNVQEKNPNERKPRNAPHEQIVKSFPPDPDHCHSDDREDGRFQSVEDGGDGGDLFIRCVNEAQSPQNEH